MSTIETVRTQSRVLIRDEVRTAEQRSRLEQSVRNAILTEGCDINEVSEASGLAPREIRRVLDLLPDQEPTNTDRLVEVL